MNRQRTAALLIAAVSLSGVAATPALAAGHGGHGKGKAHAAKAASRPAPFTAVGRVSAVDVTAKTVSITVKHHRRAGTAVVSVATAKIVRNGARVGLDKVTVGDKVVAVGRRTGTAVPVASHLNVAGPRPTAKPAPTGSASASPSTVAEPQPVASASEPTS